MHDARDAGRRRRRTANVASPRRSDCRVFKQCSGGAVLAGRALGTQLDAIIRAHTTRAGEVNPWVVSAERFFDIHRLPHGKGGSCSSPGPVYR